MAPEVIELKGASTASDIWSLGCTIIELLTGKPPYGDLLPMSALFRIVEDERPPLPKGRSAQLDHFLNLCFLKNPASRPSAEQLFEHEWLKTYWDPYKDMLRPQDSIPFLRRISTEMRRLSSSSIVNSNPTEMGSSVEMLTPPTSPEMTSPFSKRITPPEIAVSLPEPLVCCFICGYSIILKWNTGLSVIPIAKIFNVSHSLQRFRRFYPVAQICQEYF